MSKKLFLIAGSILFLGSMNAQKISNMENLKFLSIEEVSEWDVNPNKKTEKNSKLNLLTVEPQRAVKKTSETQTLLDSIVTRHSNGDLLGKEIYEYDDRLYRIRETYYSYEQQQWVPSSKTEYDYDEKGKEILCASYSYKNGVWEFGSKTKTVYDKDTDNNTITETTNFSGSNASGNWEWVPYNKYETTLYGETNIIKYYFLYQWNVTQGIWENHYKTEQLIDYEGYSVLSSYYQWDGNKWIGKSKYGYIYDVDETFTQFNISFTWNDDVNDWTEKSISEYDANEDLLSVACYVLENNVWLAKNKESYEGKYIVHYNVVNNEFVKVYRDYTEADLYKRYDWDEDTESWYLSLERTLFPDYGPKSKIETAYNKQGQELYYLQIVEGGPQVYNWKKVREYNENGFQILSITYNYILDTDEFVETRRNEVIYDTDNRISEKIYYSYGIETDREIVIYDTDNRISEIVVYSYGIETGRNTYYYSDHSTAIQETKNNSFRAYSDGNKTITAENNGREVWVYDMNGKLLMQVKSAASSVKIEVSQSGVYFVRCNNEVQKVIAK